MKQIKYNNIEGLKKDFLSIFKDNHILVYEWPELRNRIISAGGDEKLYPQDISDLLIADFELLAYLFFDYNKLDLPQETRQDIDRLFAFKSKWHSAISDYFSKHATDIGISTCYYCDTAYINTYKVKNSNKRHFDLDHFLPKSQCPLVSFSLFNLIPCCPVCNQRLKRNKVLGCNAQESISLSPSSKYYAFDDYSHFAVLPIHIGKGLRFVDNADNYKVEIIPKLDVCKKEINMFQLNDRYDFHKIRALRLLDLIKDYPPAHIKMIHNVLIKSGAFHSEQKITEDIFGNQHAQNYKRAFAKLILDVMKTYRQTV